MKDKEYPIFTMLVCTVAAWAIAKIAIGSDKSALMVAIATFIYSVYLGSIYAENGKQAMLKRLKEQTIRVVGTIAFLAVSIWITGVISSWIGVESVIAKFLVWFGLMIIIVIIEIQLAARKK